MPQMARKQLSQTTIKKMIPSSQIAMPIVSKRVMPQTAILTIAIMKTEEDVSHASLDPLSLVKEKSKRMRRAMK